MRSTPALIGAATETLMPLIVSVRRPSFPVISQPQVGILGLGGIEKRVKVTADDAIVIKPMMYTCLSYDHRIVDGAVADQFLTVVKKTLETADFKSLL